MRRAAVLILLLAVGAFAGAQSPAPTTPPKVVQVPPTKPGEWAEFPASPGRQLRLGTADKPAAWELLDDSAADLTVDSSRKSAVFSAPTPGEYRLVVVCGESVSRVRITVGGPVPVPPQPTPPRPVPPNPVPPGPVDPLAAKLKTAFDADVTPITARKTAAKDLAELYRQGAKLVLKREPNADGTDGRYSVVTKKELVKRIRDAGDNLTDSVLVDLRTVVAVELGTVLTTDDLTPEQRAAVAVLFGRLAVILDSLGA